MPGVDTDSTGDGTVRTVGLRGMPPAYTAITLNGVSMAAADANTGAGSSRSFSFEQMSLSNLDSIEISKTVSADVDANAPAGTINLKTKRAFDREGRRIMAQLSGTTHSNVWDSKGRTGPGEGGYGGRRVLPGGQVEYSDVFLDRRLGVVFTASESNLYVEQEQINANRNYVPTQVSPEPLAISSIKPQVGSREIMRAAASLNLDYKASDNLILALASVFNRSGIWAGSTSYTFTSGAREHGVDGDPVHDFTTRQPPSADALAVTNSLTYKDGRGRTIVPSFEYTNEHVKLDGNLSYSTSISTYDPQGRKGAANALSTLVASGDFSATRGDTILGQPWQITQLNGVDWSDPAAFTSVDPLIMRTNSGPYAEVTLKGGALNLAFDRDFGRVPVEFKTGLKSQRAEYDYRNRSDLDRYAYDGPLSLTELLGRIQSDSQVSYADSGVGFTSVDDHTDLYLPSFYKLLDLWRENPEHWAQTSTTSPSEWYGIHVGNTVDYREDVNALYFMGTADLTPRLRARAGLRWEQTRTRSVEHDMLSPQELADAGYDVDEGTGRATTIEGLEHQYLSRPLVARKGSYDHFFPSGSLKYSFDASTDLQIGYSRTIRRPEVGQLAGSWSIDEIEQIVRAPNAGLEPEISDNLSVRLARYFEPVGVVALNYFQNRIDGLFQSHEMTAEEFGYTDEEYADYTFITTETVSGDAIRIQGWELEFSHAMDYLPGAWGGLSVRGSFMVNEPEVPIVRMAEKLGSLSVSWQHGPARLFLNTAWSDDKYRSTTPSWFAEQWDTNLSGSYAFGKHLEGFFSVRNLLDRSRNVIVPNSLAPGGTLNDGQGNHGAIYIHGGRNATVGLRARF